MILLIDNYDSFTYNLYQYIAEFVQDIKVVRNDKISCDEIAKLAPEAIILSPGPGRPAQAGICVELIKRFHNSIPILGVCLGHQSIGEAFGGQIVKAQNIVHGKQSFVFHNRTDLFKDHALPFLAGRYHSLIIDKQSLPDCLDIVAENGDGMIMAIKHQQYPCYGIQFHPESILTESGITLIRNFINLYRDYYVEKNSAEVTAAA